MTTAVEQFGRDAKALRMRSAERVGWRPGAAAETYPGQRTERGIA